MGQVHSNSDFDSECKVKKRSQIHLQEQNWTLLEKHDINTQQVGSFGVYKNVVTGQIARRYDLVLKTKKELKQFIDEFDYWRSQVKSNVIESKYLIFEKENLEFSNFCGKYFPVKIFVENSVVTLAEIKDIPLPQGLFIVLSCLIGFQHLFSIFGYFLVTQSMVTINQHGIVKVWIHPNLSSNRPLSIGLNNVTQNDIECPGRFIRQLIELVDNNIDYGNLKAKFSDQVNKNYPNNNEIDFYNCKKLLLNYAQQLRFDLPDSLTAILDLLFDKSNHTSISQQNLSHNNGPTLYGKNYQNKYLLGEDSEHLDDLQNVQSPSSNTQFLHRSPSNQIGSFYPQDNQFLNIRNSAEQISEHFQSSEKKANLPRNYSYNQKKTNQENEELVYINHNHRKSFPIQSYLTQQSPVGIKQHNEEFIENPYNPLVQRQQLVRQSTIRQELEEDSFLTSYKNGKFQSSKDLKRSSNHLRKHNKNTLSHHLNLTSQSQIKIITEDIENCPPLQVTVRSQASKKLSQNQSQLSFKKSQKSILFHTLYEVKQLDAEIAADLQKMLNNQQK